VKGDLELEIGAGSRPGDYLVRVVHAAAGGAPVGRLELDVHQVLSGHDQLAATVLGSAAGTMSEAEHAVREVGSRLFRGLFAEELYGTYRASLGATQERGKRLRVALRLTAPELAVLPWETLFDPDTETYLCRREPLVRHVPAPYTPDPLEVRPPLRILGLVASPQDLPPLDVDAEQARLAAALANAKAAGLVKLDWVVQATWEGVHARLLAGEWHVVHFVGHCDYDSRTDEGVLALVGADGRAHRVEASRLADLLGQAEPSPRLVVLNSCSSGESGAQDLFSGTAAALARSGISAVAAMQFPISDTAAIAFARGFYTAMARGRAVDEAFRHGRISILGARGTLEWVTPVLYLRGEATQLFTLTAADVSQSAPPRVSDLDWTEIAPAQVRDRALAMGSPFDDDVRFTVYRPRRVRPNRWYSMLAFAHKTSPVEMAPGEGIVDPVQVVDQQAQALLREEGASFAKLVGDSSIPLLRGTELLFEPWLDGVEFNPVLAWIRWEEPVHHAEFRFSVPAQLEGHRLSGGLRVFVGVMLIGEVTFQIEVNSTTDRDTSCEPLRVNRYRRIFASYSHLDADIVRAVAAFGQLSGDEYYIDAVTLRSGQRWEQRLLELIDEADVFQLFWSTNAMRSEPVRWEVEHALRLEREGFIRPVRWEEPLPKDERRGLPPPAVLALHFSRLPTVDLVRPLPQPPALPPRTGFPRERAPKGRPEPLREGDEATAVTPTPEDNYIGKRGRARERRPFWRRRNGAGLLAGAAVAAVAAATAAILANQPGDDSQVVAMMPTELSKNASGTAEIRETPSGFAIELDLEGLPPAPESTYYQGWLKNATGDLVTIGTFHGHQGTEDVVMWSGVDPEKYSTITVTLQREGAGAESSGQVVLRGTVQ
jgi:CHAT domain/Anti-sigma-K factor rskA/TIR domain